MKNKLLLKFRDQNSIYSLIFHHKYLVNDGKIRYYYYYYYEKKNYVIIMKLL